MKKMLVLLVLIVLLSNCDDGNLTVDAINFDDVTASSCGEIIYKLKDSEALFIKIPESKNAFINDDTPLNSPIRIAIDSDVSLKYRFYNGTVSSDNICLIAGPITPVATSEWIATSGTIEVTTTAQYANADVVTGQKKIIKYNHQIIIKNLVFAKPDGSTQKYDSFTFGNYLTDVTSLAFSFDSQLVASCAGNTKIYNARNNGVESLVIENPDTDLIQNTGTVTKSIGLTSNKLVYKLYTNTLPATIADYFCTTTTPSTPTVKEEWVATAGTIEISNTTAGGFLHTIRLKNVTFKKVNGNSSFYYGDDILFGELLLAN